MFELFSHGASSLLLFILYKANFYWFFYSPTHHSFKANFNGFKLPLLRLLCEDDDDDDDDALPFDLTVPSMLICLPVSVSSSCSSFSSSCSSCSSSPSGIWVMSSSLLSTGSNRETLAPRGGNPTGTLATRTGKLTAAGLFIRDNSSLYDAN